MSIAARVVPFSRSFRSLIKKTHRMAKAIKDLKDLKILRGRAGYRHSGPTDLRDVFFIVGRETGNRPTMKGLSAAVAPVGTAYPRKRG